MKITTLSLLILLPILVCGQGLKKVSIQHKNPNFKEVYYVLKSDKSTRHGNYQKLNYNNAVVINGYYKNGLKDSIWNEYYWKGKKLKTKGNYTQDLKVGVWEFYNYEAKLQQKYDFTKKELLFNIDDNKINDKKYKVINGTDTTEVVLEREPLYIGGDAMMYYSISRIIRYPRAARENGTSGKVFIAFIIDVNGKTSDHRVERGIGSGCDEEALKVVKEMPDTWIPGIMNGQKVVVEMLTPISFVLR